MLNTRAHTSVCVNQIKIKFPSGILHYIFNPERKHTKEQLTYHNVNTGKPSWERQEIRGTTQQQ